MSAVILFDTAAGRPRKRDLALASILAAHRALRTGDIDRLESCVAAAAKLIAEIAVRERAQKARRP